ncbi:putative RNA-binding protein ylmH [[Clostridium] ultunense Esp]|nr:putative RNA-binding protein ylmH [[Clostridium] ultunense Esp]
MEKNLLQHFRPEEAPFIEKAGEWISFVEEKGLKKLTDFLDPRQMEILRNLAMHRGGIALFENGGYEGAERKRTLLLPEGENPPEEEEFHIGFLHIRPRGRFYSLEHRDYLGALLHVGIKREKFGDLWTVEEGAMLVLAEEMADYVSLQLTEVGRVPVVVERKEKGEWELPTVKLEERRITTSSMRLDAVLAEMLPLSRAKTSEWIKGGKVKRNHRVAVKPDEEVKVGDLLSVREYGRFYLLEEMGRTKKGNILLRVGIPDS